MKLLAILVVLSIAVGFSGTAFAASNPVAIGVEQVTKTPFTMLKDGNQHLFTPVKEINHSALDFTDNARAATVSVGLNLGEPVEW